MGTQNFFATRKELKQYEQHLFHCKQVPSYLISAIEDK